MGCIRVINLIKTYYQKQNLMKVKFQVNAVTVKETELQREMHKMVQETTELKKEFSEEKSRLTEELKVMLEELNKSKVSYSGTGSLHSDNSVCTFPLFFF